MEGTHNNECNPNGKGEERRRTERAGPFATAVTAAEGADCLTLGGGNETPDKLTDGQTYSGMNGAEGEKKGESVVGKMLKGVGSGLG